MSLRRGPSRSSSAARGRCGTPPASTRIRPRGWCSAGFVPPERGAGPIAVRSPPVTSSAPGSPANFGQPRPRTRYGRPHGDAWRPGALTPLPPSTRAHAPPTPAPPLSPHTPPLPPGPLPSLPFRLTGAAREPTSRRDVHTATGPPPPAGVPGLLPHSCPPPPPRPQHTRAAPAVLCRPHKHPRTPRPHQQCCAGPTGTPARQGRTSCAVQAPQEPPHARAAPAVLCKPHSNPRTSGPHQLCCARPTETPARQGRTSCAVQAPRETGGSMVGSDRLNVPAIDNSSH